MLVVNRENEDKLTALLPWVMSTIDEWQLVSVKLLEAGKDRLDRVMETLTGNFQDNQGMIVPIKDFKAVMLVSLGAAQDFAKLKAIVEKLLSKFGVNVVVKRASDAALKDLQLDREREESGEKSYFETRLAREGNVALIVEDDDFIRQMLTGALSQICTVHESVSADTVVEQYKENNPDLVVLDIHLPGGNGMALVEELMSIDTDAHILITSSDSTRGNVLEALARGAYSFLAKPIKKSRMVEALKLCPTFKI